MGQKRVCFQYSSHYLIVGIISIIVSLQGCAQSQKLIVESVNDPRDIDSAEYNYGSKNLDIIWNISYPVEINITRFELNSQAGDFLIICEYPLPSDLVVSGAAAEDVIHLLPIENSLILSPQVLPNDENDDDDDEENSDEGNKVEKLQRVHIGNPYGGFIYFHGSIDPKLTFEIAPKNLHNHSLNGNDSFNSENSTEYDMYDQEDENSTHIQQLESDDVTENSRNSIRGPEIQAYEFQGFKLQIKYLELNPTTTERTTTEKLKTGMFLRKYIKGKKPGEFLADLGNFKWIVASMANEFISHDLDITFNSTVLDSDIRLDQETIFFCEPRFAEYKTCVEIQLAIPVRDNENNLFMNCTLLEDMWNLYGDQFLKKNGSNLQTYDPLAAPKLEKTWLWLAAILSVILLFSTMLCFTFLGNIFQTRKMERNTNEAISSILENREGDGPNTNSVGSSFADNPIIHRLMTTIKKRQEDSEHFVMLDREIALRGAESLNSNPFADPQNNRDYSTKESRPGILHSHQYQKHNPMTFLNDGFIHDEDEGFSSGRHRNNINTQHHTFQAQVHSAENEAESDDDEEATEIWTNQNFKFKKANAW